MQRACGTVLMVLLCAVCAIGILISCLYYEGTNKIWAQETVVQHESFTFKTTRINTVRKQHWFFDTRKSCDLLKDCKVSNTSKKPQTWQYRILVSKLNAKTTSLSDKVTTW